MDFDEEHTLSPSSIVQPPGVIDPLDLRCPKVARAAGGAVGPDDFGFAALEAAEGGRTG